MAILIIAFDSSSGFKTGTLVDTSLIQDNAVTSAKVASGQIGWMHQAPQSTLSGQLGSGQVAPIHLYPFTSGLVIMGQGPDQTPVYTFLTSGVFGGQAVLSSMLGSGQVGDAHIYPASIISGKIASGAVTAVNIASGIIQYDRDISYFRQYGTGAQESWYTAPNTGTAVTTGAPSVGNLRAIPFIVPKTVTLDQIAIRLDALASGWNARVGIYADAGNLYPGTLLKDPGNIALGTTSGVKMASVSGTILSGGFVYWFSYMQSGAATIRCFAVASMIPILGYGSGLPTTPVLGWTVAQTYGAMPNPFTAGGTFITAVPVPAVFVRLLSGYS